MASSSLLSGLIKGRWKVVRKIGQGAFGEIFQGRNVVTNEDVAIKVERVDSKKQVLKLEVAVLKKLQPCENVVPFVTCGRHGEYNYLVMELLGDNISELRRRQVSGRFSLATTCLLALQMLKSIRAVHDMGYLHRDIKPSNFAIGLGPLKSRVYVIDFGLSRRYVLPSGKVRPPREQSGFRGTARYASINAHLAKDLARRDDLWSLLYMLIEFATGILPWRRIKDKDQVGEMKIRCNTPELVADLPKEFLLLWEHLQTLRYEDCPDYDMLTAAFTACLVSAGGSPDTVVFDWDAGGGGTAGVRPRTLPYLRDLACRTAAVNLERVVRLPPGMTPQLKERVLADALRLNSRLPEHCILKLLDASTQVLDFAAMQSESNSLYFAALGRCTGVRRLEMGQASDAHLIEAARLAPSLASLSMTIANSKDISSKPFKHLLEGCSRTLCRVKIGGDAVKDALIETVIKSLPLLNELLLGGCRKVKGSCLALFSKGKYGAQMRSLDLSGCELNKAGVKSLVKCASVLRNIRLSPLTASYALSTADLIQVVHRASELEELEIRSDLIECDSLLLELAGHSLKLRRLALSGPGLTDFGVQRLLIGCTQLRDLALQCGDGISDSSMGQLSNLTNLTSLRLQFAARGHRSLVSENAVRSLLNGAQELRELSLVNCQLLTLHTFPEEGVYTNLVKLTMSECFQLDDVAVDRVTQLCPNLKFLDLGSINGLSAVSLSSISLWCCALEELSLLGCACFEDEALLQLLRAMPLLMIHVSRFPTATLKPVDVWVHKQNVQETFSSFSNNNRLMALEKHKIYSVN